MLYQSGHMVLILCEGLTHMLPTHNAKLSGSIQVANDGKGPPPPTPPHALNTASLQHELAKDAASTTPP